MLSFLLLIKQLEAKKDQFAQSIRQAVKNEGKRVREEVATTQAEYEKHKAQWV